jgi:UrcA family protein
MSSTLLSRNLRPCRSPMRHAVALTLMVAGSVAGLAQAADEPPTERVQIGKYNLDTDAGSRAALRELSSASQRVCRVGESRVLMDVVHAKACYRESLENAVEAAGSEHLSKLYRAQSGVGLRG